MKSINIPVEGGRYLTPEQLDIFMKAVFTAKNTWKQASQDGKEGTLPATFVNCVDADR